MYEVLAMADLGAVSDTAIDKAASELQAVSNDIWSNPELRYEETFAHERLTKFLKDQGFNVEPHYKGIDTAFRATYGPENATPHVAVFCEYDALPEIGHACGHNLIAEVGVAAGLGVKAAMDAAGKTIGKLTVLGSPAEEGGGGKILLISRGALEGIDVALMSHPSGYEWPHIKTLAKKNIQIQYKGRASHASAFPWEGVNALDAAVLCYQNLSCLRQQLKPFWQIHGVITNGGAKPNIIPEMTELDYYIRAPSRKDLLTLEVKVLACVEAAAKATGCTVEITDKETPYLNVIQNETLLKTYLKHFKNMGMEESTNGLDVFGASTDMGNVSYVVPSIHPCYCIKPGLCNHTREFTAASGHAAAQRRTLTEGKILARVALDVLQNPELLAQTKEDFKKDIEACSV